MKITNFAFLALFSLASANYPPHDPKCETCNYLPMEDKCDITTSCVFVWGHTDPSSPAPYYCACRAGYRATGYDAGNSDIQWRLPWYGTPGGDPSQQGRVFVKPGTVCNTLCDDWYLGKDGCKAVQQKDACL